MKNYTIRTKSANSRLINPRGSISSTSKLHRKKKIDGENIDLKRLKDIFAPNSNKNTKNSMVFLRHSLDIL